MKHYTHAIQLSKPEFFSNNKYTSIILGLATTLVALRKRRKDLAKILPKRFEALWRSMPYRVQAVIEAKGWNSRYKFLLHIMFSLFHLYVFNISQVCMERIHSGFRAVQTPDVVAEISNHQDF